VTASALYDSGVSDDPTAVVRDFLERWAPRVEQRLRELLPPEDEEPRSVHAAMRYSVLAGGKRLRPALVLIGAHAAGGNAEDALGVACAVEMVHTYSLIHDDLPAMDDDDFRRGRPSCHKQFGEAVAILAGDALNTYAFEVIARTAPDPARVPHLVVELCRAAGTRGMVGGQVADLEAEDRDRGAGSTTTLPEVRGIHERKTGALLTASLRLGAIAVGGDDGILEKLDGVGRRLGLAFQIVDDVLDEEGEVADLGKTPGKDREQGKATYPAAIGISASREAAQALVDEADALLDGEPGAEVLRSLGAFFLARRS
jgi:geranylgeranyl diphosphate synthase type II